MPQYLMPEDIELYSAQLDVLLARISAISSRTRLPDTRAGRLRRMDARCRSLKRLLLRLERSDAVLHARIQTAVEHLQRGLGKPVPAPGLRGCPSGGADIIRVETAEPNRVTVKALEPAALEKSVRITR